MGRLDGAGAAVTRPARVLAVAAALVVTSAHIGDNNTHYRGPAGPYTVQVLVRHPGVVPGLADISVRVEEAGVRSVTVQPVHTRIGLEGSPRPDDATPVEGAPGLFAAQLWFMSAGAYSVRIHVAGDAGEGDAIIPVNSVATRRLPVGRGLAVTLIALGLFLVAGAVTIVRAAVSESVLPPGVVPERRLIRRGRIAGIVALAVIALALTGGRRWWNAENAVYERFIFVPKVGRAEVTGDAGRRVLSLAFDSTVGPNALLPDHGKLVHGFLVRDEDAGAFAHVHPVAAGSDGDYSLALPPLPAGRYTFYGDFARVTGFSQTMTAVVLIPPDSVTGRDAGAVPVADPDDSWWTGAPAPARADGEAKVTFEDGSTMTWERPAVTIEPDVEMRLAFVVREADGAEASLEPYMGMVSHAVVRRTDGGVFVHLHPTGSFSMAAQAKLESDEGRMAVHDVDGDAMRARGRVVIPYAFPSAGDYRLWVQVKRYGVVRTGAFDVTVSAPR